MKTVETSYYLLKNAKKEVIRFFFYPNIATMAAKSEANRQRIFIKCDNKAINSYYFSKKIPIITINTSIMPIYFTPLKKSCHQIFALVGEKNKVSFL